MKLMNYCVIFIKLACTGRKCNEENEVIVTFNTKNGNMKEKNI